MEERIKELVDKLNYYTKLYDEGHPAISDKEWDDMYFELVELEGASGIYLADSPTQKIDYKVVNELPKVTHNHPMLSLAKTKDMREIYNFLGNHDFLTMCKMDGLTCSLRYLDGKLVSAETRGDGVVGEDILHNALVVKSIPKKINYTDELIVDGEIICTYFDFEPFMDEYQNPRNFASGSIRLLDSNECAKRNLTFVAWDVIFGFEDMEYLNDKLGKLYDLGFKVVPYVPTDDWDAKEYVQNNAKELGYPIDGLVFKFNNIEFGRSQGATEHHLKNAMAYKFYDQTFPTKLKNIEWSMGRTGVLTPVAVFDFVEIDFTYVERASLHNVSIMKEVLGKPYIGQPIEVFKANMIIPQIYSAVKDAPHDAHFISIPEKCPVCGAPLEIVESENNTAVLMCTNDNCGGKLLNKLTHFCGKDGLDIKFLGERILSDLIDFGFVETYSDIFNLKNHRSEWLKKEGYGGRGVDRILESIEQARHTTFDKFLSAIGIPLIGRGVAKQLSREISDYTEFRDFVDGCFDFESIPNFGEAKAASILDFDYEEADNVYKLLDAIDDTPIADCAKTCEGLTFVITGSLTTYKNRAELTKMIEKLGGKVSGSVSRNTNYLINNDITSTSGKNKTAKDLGIPIISEEYFNAQFCN